MTVLFGDVKDVGYKPTSGVVRVSSLVTRPARESTGVITRRIGEYPLVQGRFTTGELDPGRVVVELRGEGGVFERWVFDLPLSGRLDLASALDQVVEYDSSVVSATRAAAASAAAAASRASGSEARAERAAEAAERSRDAASRVVDGAVGIVRDGLVDLRDAAVVARDEARVARDEGLVARSAAESASREAGAARDGAVVARRGAEDAASEAAITTGQLIRGEMEGFASRAEGAARDAEGHASRAAGAATEAAGLVTSVSGAVRDVVSARDVTVAARDAAGRSAEVAGEAAGRVSGVVAAAEGAASRAEGAAVRAEEAAVNAVVGAPSGGWDVAQLSAGVRGRLDEVGVLGERVGALEVAVPEPPDLSGLAEKTALEALRESLVSELAELRERVEAAPKWGFTEGLPTLDVVSRLDLTPTQWAALKHLESVAPTSDKTGFVNRALSVREISGFVGAGGVQDSTVLSEANTQLKFIRLAASQTGVAEWKSIVALWMREVA